jgi:hypothetical protein
MVVGSGLIPTPSPSLPPRGRVPRWDCGVIEQQPPAHTLRFVESDGEGFVPGTW